MRRMHWILAQLVKPAYFSDSPQGPSNQLVTDCTGTIYIAICKYWIWRNLLNLFFDFFNLLILNCFWCYIGFILNWLCVAGRGRGGLRGGQYRGFVGGRSVLVSLHCWSFLYFVVIIPFPFCYVCSWNVSLLAHWLNGHVWFEPLRQSSLVFSIFARGECSLYGWLHIQLFSISGFGI